MQMYMDGHSGKFSSTILRTWLLLLYSCFLAISVLIDLRASYGKDFLQVFRLLELFSLLFVGGTGWLW